MSERPYLIVKTPAAARTNPQRFNKSLCIDIPEFDDDPLRLQSELDDQHQESVETLLADAGYKVESFTH